jgi:hypothetical protein
MNTPANGADLLDLNGGLSTSPGSMSQFVNALQQNGLGSLDGTIDPNLSQLDSIPPGLLQTGSSQDLTSGFDSGDAETHANLQHMMQQYLQSSGGNQYTHINPAQVLGSMPLSIPTGNSVGDSPLAEASPHGPTKQMPRSVGGKPISQKTESRPKAPARSNSSPNLAGLKLVGLTAMDSSSSGNNQAKKPTSATMKQGKNVSRSGPSTPSSEADNGAGSVMTGGEIPTMCTNCQTTNTPLWRRDPDGQPLCNVSIV